MQIAANIKPRWQKSVLHDGLKIHFFRFPYNNNVECSIGKGKNIVHTTIIKNGSEKLTKIQANAMSWIDNFNKER